MSPPTRSIRLLRGREFERPRLSTNPCRNLNTRADRTTELILRSVIFRQRLRQILPPHQYKSLILQKLTKFRTLHHIEIMLPPRRSPIGMIVSRAAHFLVVVCEVNDHLVHARTE